MESDRPPISLFKAVKIVRNDNRDSTTTSSAEGRSYDLSTGTFLLHSYREALSTMATKVAKAKYPSVNRVKITRFNDETFDVDGLFNHIVRAHQHLEVDFFNNRLPMSWRYILREIRNCARDLKAIRFSNCGLRGKSEIQPIKAFLRRHVGTLTKLDLSRNPELGPEALKAILSGLQRKITRFVAVSLLDIYQTGADDSIVDELIALIQTRGSWLRRLAIDDNKFSLKALGRIFEAVAKSQLTHFSAMMPEIDRTLENPAHLKFYDNQCLVLASSPNLRHLNISNVNLDLVLPHLGPKLREVNFQHGCSSADTVGHLNAALERRSDVLQSLFLTGNLGAEETWRPSVQQLESLGKNLLEGSFDFQCDPAVVPLLALPFGGSMRESFSKFVAKLQRNAAATETSEAPLMTQLFVGGGPGYGTGMFDGADGALTPVSHPGQGPLSSPEQTDSEPDDDDNFYSDLDSDSDSDSDESDSNGEGGKKKKKKKKPEERQVEVEKATEGKIEVEIEDDDDDDDNDDDDDGDDEYDDESTTDDDDESGPEDDDEKKRKRKRKRKIRRAILQYRIARKAKKESIEQQSTPQVAYAEPSVASLYPDGWQTNGRGRRSPSTRGRPSGQRSMMLIPDFEKLSSMNFPMPPLPEPGYRSPEPVQYLDRPVSPFLNVKSPEINRPKPTQIPVKVAQKILDIKMEQLFPPLPGGLNIQDSFVESYNVEYEEPHESATRISKPTSVPVPMVIEAYPALEKDSGFISGLVSSVQQPSKQESVTPASTARVPSVHGPVGLSHRPTPDDLLLPFEAIQVPSSERPPIAVEHDAKITALYPSHLPQPLPQSVTVRSSKGQMEIHNFIGSAPASTPPTPRSFDDKPDSVASLQQPPEPTDKGKAPPGGFAYRPRLTQRFQYKERFITMEVNEPLPAHGPLKFIIEDNVKTELFKHGLGSRRMEYELESGERLDLIDDSMYTKLYSKRIPYVPGQTIKIKVVKPPKVPSVGTSSITVAASAPYAGVN